ncbi:MAG: tRNA (N(6)-L-threonylcarbamoyladenosine(37)-C(2))-methylthiotransferase MtaB [Spirochaetia bacterium]|nr:tRNA (N(6)-L-threonylcarbamoyladenosine(37)-C(2))-methylthiotransferase MtaB [Spirochaetia bacterium]
MKVSFHTYGCKVNRYETELLRQAFVRNGAQDVPEEEAQYCLINSCTVTAKIDSEILKKARALKERGHKKVIFTGCLSSRGASGELKKYLDWIIPNTEKFRVKSYPAELNLEGLEFDEVLNGFSGRSRAFLKIEDGCDSFCAYCAVPYARGSTIRSRNPEDVLHEAANLKAAGFEEMVLTGVNLGYYGRDLNEPEALYKLLVSLAGAPGHTRFRLSSIGPLELHDCVIKLAAEYPGKICPHFHLSMQSGDDKVLKLMNRKYTSSDYRDRVLAIKKLMPHAAITTDVIAGFPGEGTADFENTYEFIRSLPFTRIHVFPYSDREGTSASKMAGKVRDDVKKERVKRLIKLAEKKEMEFVAVNTGCRRVILLEEKEEDGYMEGYTENYIKVTVEANDSFRTKKGKLVPVTIEGMEGGRVMGVRADKDGF